MLVCKHCSEEMVETEHDWYICENDSCEYLEEHETPYECEYTETMKQADKADHYLDMLKDGDL